MNNKINYIIEYASHIQLFKYNGEENVRFEGIINYITNSSCENVSDKGIVNFTSSSSSQSEGCAQKNSVDLKSTRNYFQSKNVQNSWLLNNFKRNIVIPTGYSIRTRHDCNYHHPKNWAIEGSNTGGENNNEWIVLDSHENDTTLQCQNFSYTFNIKRSKANHECYRYLRYRQTGFDSNGCYYITISALEYFGANCDIILIEIQ